MMHSAGGAVFGGNRAQTPAETDHVLTSLMGYASQIIIIQRNTHYPDAAV